MKNITVVILTFNEQIHIERCIESAKRISDTVYVIDSFSSDDTVKIAEACGVKVLFRKFDSHAAQFNWGLTQIANCDWVVRMDADEYLTKKLQSSIVEAVDKNDTNLAGYSFKRRIFFLGRKIKYGGVFPVEIVRMFRFGAGRVEARLMDEHIVVEGPIGRIEGEIIDDNKSSLTWWIGKHNRYSSLEAYEMYLSRGQLDTVGGYGAATKRRHKLKLLYLSFPVSLRALMLFLYRYFVRLGFLDGFYGFLFHFYQGYWYRFLVDSKYTALIEAIDMIDDDLATLISNNLEIPEDIVKSRIESKSES